MAVRNPRRGGDLIAQVLDCIVGVFLCVTERQTANQNNANNGRSFFIALIAYLFR